MSDRGDARAGSARHGDRGRRDATADVEDAVARRDRGVFQQLLRRRRPAGMDAVSARTTVLVLGEILLRAENGELQLAALDWLPGPRAD